MGVCPIRIQWGLRRNLARGKHQEQISMRTYQQENDPCTRPENTSAKLLSQPASRHNIVIPSSLIDVRASLAASSRTVPFCCTRAGRFQTLWYNEPVSFCCTRAFRFQITIAGLLRLHLVLPKRKRPKSLQRLRFSLLYPRVAFPRPRNREPKAL